MSNIWQSDLLSTAQMTGFDVISYLESAGIDYVTQGKNVSAGWVGTPCPACHDSSNHLGINLESGSFNCFRCGESGNRIKLIQLLENCNKSAAIKIARKFSNSDFIYKREERVPATSIEFPAHISKKFTSDFLQYLTNRRFDADFLIRKYDLYCGGYFGEFRYRIVVPVYYRGDILTFVGRDITNTAELRYKAYPIEKSIAPVKAALYNIDTAKDRCVVVEGIFDAWRIGDGAVASFGTIVTDEQIRMLARFKKVFILFDYDAIKPAKKLAASLQYLTKTEIVVLDQGDPADMNDFEVHEIRRDLRL